MLSRNARPGGLRGRLQPARPCVTELGMRPPLDTSDPLIPAMSLDSSSDNAMNALYRAALGPMNTAHYLPVFERFDATGRTTTTWNWAASVFTLGWMVFRQLWTPALVYVAAAEGLALLVFALGRVLLQWPQGIEWGVLATVAVLAFAVPGMYGNAMLYSDIRKRIARALAASRTVPEACDMLASEASTRRRLQMLILGHSAIVGAGAVTYLLVPQEGVRHRFATEPEVTVAQVASASAVIAAPVASGAVSSVIDPVSATRRTASTPAASQAATPLMTSLPASSPSAATMGTVTPPATSAPLPEPKSIQPVANSPAPAEGPSSSGSAAQPAADASSAEAATPQAATAVPRTPAPPRTAKTGGPTAPAPAASGATSKSPKGATATPTSASAGARKADEPEVPPPVGSLPGYYINVGLFADEANARKAQARLLNEGLPAFRQELTTAAGRRIRVRVGPYATRAQATKAAASIKAMKLEAVVFKQ